MEHDFNKLPPERQRQKDHDHFKRESHISAGSAGCSKLQPVARGSLNKPRVFYSECDSGITPDTGRELPRAAGLPGAREGTAAMPRGGNDAQGGDPGDKGK